MLDTLDARLAQTRDGTLGHLDFLQVLCEDEIARRESAALTRRIRRARFEEQSTFESFDFTANTKLPAAMLRDLAALRWLDAAESVILYGPVGVGKTHMAQALGHAVARRGGDVRFAKTSRVLSDLAGGHADRTWGQRIREYTKPLVLILDDFAMREHTAMHADDLYELISDRAVNGRPLILTSNRSPKDDADAGTKFVVTLNLEDALRLGVVHGPDARLAGASVRQTAKTIQDLDDDRGALGFMNWYSVTSFRETRMADMPSGLNRPS
jgi:DNA replication protein DnaC